jgi:phosphomannomutase / phosphoglucomutase
MVSLPATIFRAYDIRGIADRDLTTENIYLIGRAIGRLALEHQHQELLFGADGRLSSPALALALKKGILDAGCNILDLGTVPTPLLYFATHTTHCNSGVMLTASHNPADYNGVKMVRERSCLTPEEIQALREYSLKLIANIDRYPAPEPGHISQIDILPSYLERISSDVKLSRPLKVVVDCGNAVPGMVAPAVFSRLGCTVFPLFCELDGNFPNHHPDPTIAANLAQLIDEIQLRQADVGIALDGDGDRVVIVTNKGRVIDTDRLLMLFVRDILPRYKNPNVVYDVKCSNLVAREISACGGQAILSRSGHSFMKLKMQQTDAVVGAEFSAHVFIKDRWYGYDDGFYVAARFLEILAASTVTADELLEGLPASIVTPEIRIDVADDRKFTLMHEIAKLAAFPDAIINHLDGVRADFADGWGLIRASNTTPALLLRFEAGNAESLTVLTQAFRQLLQQVAPDLDFSI